MATPDGMSGSRAAFRAKPRLLARAVLHQGDDAIMRLIIIGSGYVGLVSGACLAELGNEVLCVDSDADKIARLEKGDIPIFEPQLCEMITRNVAAGRLAFATGLPVIGPQIDAVFIAVGTPPQPNGRGADLSHVRAAAAEIAARARAGVLVVVKSTVPAGTGDAIERLIHDVRPGLPVAVASNPEFLREGSAIADFMHPDRVIIGTENAAARKMLRTLYSPLAEAGASIVCTGRRAAEIIKYASNAFLATKIAFINEIADLCEVAGADIREVSAGIGLDRRIGSAFLQAGPGYGGSCFPKDTSALVAGAQERDVSLSLVEATIAANEARKHSLGRRVAAALGGDLTGKTVAVLGLTFKPDTDDMRDAPSLALIASLHGMGARVRAYDPQGMASARTMLDTMQDHVTYTRDAYACAAGADCIVLATEWAEFKGLDPVRLAAIVKTSVLVDLRNALDAARFLEAGFSVHGVGRSPLAPVAPTDAAVRLAQSRTAGVERVKRAPINGPAAAQGVWDPAPG